MFGILVFFSLLKDFQTRQRDDEDASSGGRIAFMKEPKIRAESLPPQQPICTLAITLPSYTGQVRFWKKLVPSFSSVVIMFLFRFFFGGKVFVPEGV